MFELTGQPIDTRFDVPNPHTGGIVTFEGRVRSINEGKKVSSLEYEAYPELAYHEGEKIIKEALAKFDILSAYALHRTGHLDIGDVAVFVISMSMHRREAFEATQYIIDHIKDRVPIWKKEHYVDGEALWVRCDRCGSHG